jgi:hypothetical protein
MAVDTFRRTFRYPMPATTSKGVQRTFPWRQSFLLSLGQTGIVASACKSAGISRNTVYVHLRKDARFRRQWERALSQGCDLLYRQHSVRLATDPQCLRALERFRSYYGSESRPYLALKNLLG